MAGMSISLNVIVYYMDATVAMQWWPLIITAKGDTMAYSDAFLCSLDDYMTPAYRAILALYTQ